MFDPSIINLTEEVDNSKTEVDETAHKEILEELHKVQAEYEDLHLRHEAQIRDNTQLSRSVI